MRFFLFCFTRTNQLTTSLDYLPPLPIIVCSPTSLHNQLPMGSITYLAQTGVLKPSITAWLVTSFQTALLGTAERLITGCGAPADGLVKLQVVLPRGHKVLGGYQIRQGRGCRKQGGYGALLKASHHHHLNEKRNMYSHRSDIN